MMRGLWRIGVVIGLVLATLGGTWASAGTACACSCVPRSIDDILASDSALVQGRAVSESVDDQTVTYVFEVDYSYKRAVPWQIEVRTPASGASCGVVMEIGQPRTLSIGVDENGDWTTMLCDNLALTDTIPAAAGPRLDALPGPDLTGGSETATAWGAGIPWAVGGVLVLIGGAVLAWRVRRRP